LAIVFSKETIDQLNGKLYVSFHMEEIYLAVCVNATFIVYTDLLAQEISRWHFALSNV